jgi:ABC-2 type transport system ATP-binding protein
MLTTLLRPTGGDGFVAGHDLLKDPAGVRRNIGYVAQGGGTSPDNSVREELLFQGRVYGLSKHDSQVRATELLTRLDLGALERRLVRTLSGGQRRRLDVALGLVHAPPLVFLDEPTAGLDPQSRANLWDHVKRLRDESGSTVFLTTHYLDEADALADRILIVDHGRIVAEGTPEALKTRVSGDRIVMEVRPEAAVTTTNLVSRVNGAHDVRVDGPRVSFRAPQGSLVLAGLLRELDDAGITVTSLQVQQPSLDDVFLEITGRSLREPEAAEREMVTHVA